MPRGKSKQDPSMLAMALLGYEMEKKKIEERIKEIRSRISGGSMSARLSGETNNQPTKRRSLSVAARKRIAAAQRKRWAERRKSLQTAKG
jgi:hypothetical protein